MMLLLGRCHGKSSCFVLISGRNLLEDELDFKMGRDFKNTLPSFFGIICGETFCKRIVKFSCSKIFKLLNYFILI